MEERCIEIEGNQQRNTRDIFQWVKKLEGWFGKSHSKGMQSRGGSCLCV